ncbi:unnamed protein product, partial [Candidula unifasciata]
QNTKMAMVMEELHRHLGGGDKSVKMHLEFWITIGHPKPFTTEKEASVFQSLAQIVSSLALCCSDSQLTLKKKVDAFTGSGLSFQSQIQEIMQFIANGELSEAQTGLQSLASVLTRSGLLQGCKTAPNMSESQNETVGQTDAELLAKDGPEGSKKPAQFLSLWPLFGHMSLLAEMSAVGRQLLQQAVVESTDASTAVVDLEPVEVSDVTSLRDFVVSHLPELTNWSLVSRAFSN